ncbi:MAG: hypothetical protein ACM3JH_05330 [Acidithiobacillales bacterium]
MLPALVLAAVGLSGAPPTLVRYDVVEAIRALTPAGPRDRAVAGTVTAMGGKARWDLTASRFPDVRARSALWGGGGLVLLDPDASVATPVSAEEFGELFQAPPGAAGLSTAGVRDLSASVARDGKGAPFEGIPTERWAVRCSWTLVSAQPGRLVRVKHEVLGKIETIEDPSLSPTPFDDLLRLFRARGEAREALEAQLRKLKGLPVRVRLDETSEALAEAVGAAGGGAAPGSPVRATSTTTRTVSNLRRRPAAEGDASLFTVPESYRSVPLERVKTGSPRLP